MERHASVLVVDDEEFVREFIADALRSQGHEIHTAAGVSDARRMAADCRPDVLVTDVQLSDGTGLELVRHFGETYPSSSVIVITAFPDQEKVDFAEEREVCAFLTKPFSAQQIRYSVMGAIRASKGASEHLAGTADADDDLGLIGSSPYIRRLRKRILSVASGEFPILIQGESGTGKELVAHAIHARSPRGSRPLMTINCAAIPRHLEESEFFGHAKGSFTGAASSKHGIIASADNSTLFLDEVGELSLGTQAKLLRVLDSGEYLRVGDTVPRHVDIRVLSATNRDLGDMVESGTFRKDLYFRLKGSEVRTEVLSTHREDIPALVRAFLESLTTRNGPRQITAEALEYLVRQPWEGNTRELKHTVSLLAHAAKGTRRIDMATIEMVLQGGGEAPGARSLTYQEAKERALRDFEVPYFTELLKRHNGNVNRAARDAGMHRPNLIKKLKALSISADNFRG